MQYLLLIYAAESVETGLDQGAIMAEYGTFTQGIVQSGAFKSADRLKPVGTATTGGSATARPDHRRSVRRRPASSSAATIWSRPRTSTRRPRSPPRSRPPSTARSRCGRSGQ
ncbi:MAG: hypothetical protein WDM85_15500 [Caulobacteraceae bacterium]